MLKNLLPGLLLCPMMQVSWAEQAAESPAQLRIESGTAGELALELEDRANASWLLQTSPDGREWTSLESVRVPNSTLSIRGLELPANPAKGFFRAVSVGSTPPLSLEEALALPATTYNYAKANNTPSHLARIVSRVTIDNRKATLGRVLFYDRRLSANNAVSCASCHLQENAFADPQRLSPGFEGRLTDRNTHTLLGVRTYGGRTSEVFMDGRATNLREAISSVIEHPSEMGMSLESLPAKLAAEPYYQPLWQAAFGELPVSGEGVVEALAQFVEAMPTFSTRYDAFLTGDLQALTAQEQQGRTVFGQRCNGCHIQPLVSGQSFENNGLDAVTTDPGRGAVTGLASDMGKFRPPSLRNIARTAPYMHDGRFATLREVIEFYDHGTRPHPNRSSKLEQPINLSEADKLALEAFLRSLDDTAPDDPAFSDPFRSELEIGP
ncbi:cytochrome-c peroxidase [Luteolibacter marinus]|uniref:cytochrome-c peroxidase n=1 Tax=Luteolibacter marinus TaxID=2776705 RepID=UPI001866C574|nr:cytochrome c peroxidase [Luteolibacter marinus]